MRGDDAVLKLHFQEADFVIYFPATGNEGRPLGKYGVAYRARARSVGQEGKRIYLEDVLAMPEVRDRYPHTVGLYVHSAGKGRTWRPQYLQTRVVQSEPELLDWIGALGEAAPAADQVSPPAGRSQVRPAEESESGMSFAEVVHRRTIRSGRLPDSWYRVDVTAVRPWDTLRLEIDHEDNPGNPILICFVDGRLLQERDSVYFLVEQMGDNWAVRFRGIPLPSR